MSERQAADGPGLVRVDVRVGAGQVPLADLALAEHSPGGFAVEEHDDGSVTYGVTVPAPSAESVTAWLARAGVEVEDVATELVPAGWEEAWKEFHQPVAIGGFWVAPPWLADEAPEGARPLLVEPGRGFGTGAHPTTMLMLALLAEQPRCSVLDVGTGSGVLAIAAALQRFSPVVGIDNDPAAIESARANLARNGVDSLVKLMVRDAEREDVPKADLVLANILLEPLVVLARRVQVPRVIVSGILRSQAAACQAAWEEEGYVLRERRDRDGWVAMVLDHVDPELVMRHRAVH